MDYNYYNQNVNQVQGQYYGQMSQNNGSKIFEMMSLCIGVVAFLMAVIGSMLAVNLSAGKTFDWENLQSEAISNITSIAKSVESLNAGKIYDSLSEVFEYETSLIIILPICGGVLACVSLIIGILAYKKKNSKKSLAAIIISVTAFVIGIIPSFTVCVHNCSLNSQNEQIVEDVVDTAKKFIK